MKFIEDLYYTDLAANVRPASYWQERRDVGNRRELCRKELLAELTESQKKQLESLEKCYGEHSLIDERHAFIIGFRLGVRMMAEALADDN